MPLQAGSDDDIDMMPIAMMPVSHAEEWRCDAAKTCAKNTLETYQPPKLFHAVLKISNISWDTSIADIQKLFNSQEVGADQIHIPIDRNTGKTLSDLFVELADVSEVFDAICSLNRRLLKGRALFLAPSSYDELYRVHFGPAPKFISHGEGLRLVNICTNYKVYLHLYKLLIIFYKMYFSRKCAQRPFEHLISLLRLIPWFELDNEQLVVIYHLVHGAISALRHHISRRPTGKLIELDGRLMTRLLESAKAFPLFSDAQLVSLVAASESVTDDSSSEDDTIQTLFTFKT